MRLLGPLLPTAPRVPAEQTEVFYDGMSGGLAWTDELIDLHGVSAEEVGCFRALFRYRTGLITEDPDTRFESLWTLAKAEFPGWIGFAPERCAPNAELAALYTRKSRRFLREIQRIIDCCDRG